MPVTIGFYAIPELIEMATAGSSISKLEVERVGGVWEGVRDTFRHWLLVIRCSALGTFISIIPGLGAATTQWLAYAHAVQSSPGRERFGKGAVEGVLGPGAANNSSLGGSLVTTVAFGVPASVATAILMGAFFVQGLVPGPAMLTPAPKGHLAVTLAMVWTIVISNIITVAICLAFMGPLARITQIRGTLLVPFILILVYVGAFAEKNVFEDLGVVLAFGALGWVMAKLDWPRPPLLLGLVLGPLAENRLFLSTDNYGAAWLLRPGVLIIAAVMAVGLIVPLVNRRQSGPVSPPAHAPAGARGRRLNGALAFDLGLVLLFAAALWLSRRFDVRAGLFPWTITAAGLLLAIVHTARELATPRPTRTPGARDDHSPSAQEDPTRRTAAICGWILGMYAAIWLLGFSVATLVTTFLYLRTARERWPISIVLSLAGFAFVYGLFEKRLSVPFPPAQLLVWLGYGG